MINYDEQQDLYILEGKGVIVLWDEKPDSFEEEIGTEMVRHYNNSIHEILDYIFEDLKIYVPDLNRLELENKLKTPYIDANLGQVYYFDHEFDEISSIGFEFFDNEFKDLGSITIS